MLVSLSLFCSFTCPTKLQKGCTTEQRPLLETGLGNLVRLWQRDMGLADLSDIPGGGAAGGLGAGLIAFCGGRLQPGLDMLADQQQLATRMDGAALVFTGEGQVDESSATGKVPMGVAARAKVRGIPCVALCGSVGPASALHGHGLSAVFSICKVLK